MASPVPYSGVPDVSPQVNPISPVHEDTPIAAFGGTVAQAVEHVGDVAQGVGKELFARGYAFQELNEQVKADQAASDTMDAQTQRYLDYSKLKGNDLVDGNKQYVQDLQKIRQDNADDLDSPYAKQKYLDESRKTQSQMIWHGGVLARQGQDEAATIAASGQTSAAINRFSTLDPNDTHTWDTTVQQITDAEENKLHLKGGPAPGSPEAAAAAKPAISSAVSQLVLSKINSDHPEQSKVFAKKALADGSLLPEDYDKLEWKMDNAINGKLGRKIGSQAGADTSGKNVKEIVQAARDTAEKTDPGNKVLSDNAADAALARHDHEEQLELAASRQTFQSLRRVVDGTDTNGKVPISLEEAQQDPNFRQTYNDSPPEVQGQVRELIRKNQSTDGWIANEDGTRQFNQLYTTLKDPRASATEVDEALNTNLVAANKMTREQRFVIGNLQDQTLKNQSSPGSINSALHMPSVQMALQNAGLQKGTDEYNDFVTKFTQSVEHFSEGSHRTVKDNEQLGKIANSMLMSQAGSWVPWKNASDPMYKDPFAANPALKAQALKEYKTLYNKDPTDDELNQMSGAMYNKYFEQLGASSRPGQPKSTNRVTSSSGSQSQRGPQ